MHFNYGFPAGTSSPYAGYTPYAYTAARRVPRIEIVQDTYHTTRPFERQETLVDLITRADAAPASDPLEFSEGRAQTQWLQMEALLKHLGARHVIHHQIKTGIEYDEGRLHARLDDLKTGSAYRGQSGKFETDLLKQLDRLTSERRAEDVACWRDTGRILSEICDLWTERADQVRKTRLMGFDL